MGIIVTIDVVLAKRKVSVTKLSEKVGITMANLSILRHYVKRLIASLEISFSTSNNGYVCMS
jgi:DNA-binding Xre family transcriptional regulator